VFDIGFWEMSLIALIALVVLGPERLPGLARTAGHWIGRARRMISEVKADIDREIRNAEIKEMKSLKDDIESTGREFSKQVSDSSKIGDDVKDELDLSAAIQDSAREMQKPEPSSETEENGKKQ
jgi:sec-independent protein translocase protein TatB